MLSLVLENCLSALLFHNHLFDHVLFLVQYKSHHNACIFCFTCRADSIWKQEEEEELWWTLIFFWCIFGSWNNRTCSKLFRIWLYVPIYIYRYISIGRKGKVCLSLDKEHFIAINLSIVPLSLDSCFTEFYKSRNISGLNNLAFEFLN